MVMGLTEFKMLWDSVTQGLGLTHDQKVIASFALVGILGFFIIRDANAEERKNEKGNETSLA